MKPLEARRDARPWLLAGLAGLIGLAVLHVWTPSDDPATAICLSRRLLHLPCPACGLTRAFAHLAKGEWSAALALHPLAPVLALEAVLGWLGWGVALLRRRSFRLPVTADALLLGHAAVLVALWLGRMATGTLPW
ncbi:MAG TPA: DUF2752 domain-containing protein [Thermoanaerobaculia bacterium]